MASRAEPRNDGMVVVVKIRGRDSAGRFMSYSSLREALGKRHKHKERFGGSIGKLLAKNKTRVKLVVYRPVGDAAEELESWDVTHYWLAN
ncbi:MAG: hypothetical protein JRN62_03945 [Nitrososphaerota archaeon]|nr:hypothetical protein [Nitrososphaerota archaeon]MDG6948755.1 hypothetical protein [Nitrososphaerota archaeon]